MGGSADITICEDNLRTVDLTAKGRIVPIVLRNTQTDDIVRGRGESG